MKKQNRDKRITGESNDCAIDENRYRLATFLDAHPVVFLAKQSSRVCASDVQEDCVKLAKKQRGGRSRQRGEVVVFMRQDNNTFSCAQLKRRHEIFSMKESSRCFRRWTKQLRRSEMIIVNGDDEDDEDDDDDTMMILRGNERKLARQPGRVLGE